MEILAVVAAVLAACNGHCEPPRAPYVPLAGLEGQYGTLIIAGNHPTNDINGTGDRMGLFRDAGGTVWGLPLTIASGGAVLGCVPPSTTRRSRTPTPRTR